MFRCFIKFTAAKIITTYQTHAITNQFFFILNMQTITLKNEQKRGVFMHVDAQVTQMYLIEKLCLFHTYYIYTLLNIKEN